MAMSKERLSPERIEVIVSKMLQDMPESYSMPEMRNLVVELLFGLGLHPNDLPFFMMMKVLVPAFFSRKDTKTPMYAAIAALALNIALNYYLAFILGYGHTGLAFASSVSALLSCGILYTILIKDNYKYLLH